MKMDPDCIRDILLQTEERFVIIPLPRLNFDTCKMEDPESLPKEKYPYIYQYDMKKLIYHVELAAEMDFIKLNDLKDIYKIEDLTAQGHLLLADIRNEDVWSKTKDIAKKTGTFSLDALKQIAVNVVSSMITNYFQG
ncbi:DUF2513 domain-containing protein [Fusobacterium polymorphum]|uniref:DUF2513 domain-containing protein n=1 Tax=Fusobacterium nucleatum subsp. polymorphum TaxID=76857 RepID=UPI0030D0742E